MARKSRVNILNDIAIEEKIVLAGEYARLSVEDGDDIEQNSIGNQQKIVSHYLDEHPEIKLVDTYYDNGCTGMNYNRPGFLRMINDLKIGRINCVIVKDISRLGRHFVMTSEFVEQIFPEIGVRLICINDSYDSNDFSADASALTLPLKMVMNDYYVKDISNKIRSSISAKMEIGEYIPSSSSIPYGYIRNAEQATYDIDFETAEVVREIYRLRAKGTSFTKITCILNEKNIPSPGKIRFLRGLTKAEKYENAVWCRRTISKICSDQVYIGNRVHGTVKSDKVGLDKKRRSKDEWKIIKNAHPAIISEEIYEKVQKININESQRRKEFNQRAGFEEDYRELFRGKIFCAECHSVMSARKGCARRDAKTPSRIFYDCNNYVESSRMQCASHYIRQETILKAITDTLNQQVKMAVDIEQLIEKLKDMPKVISYQNGKKDCYQSIFIQRKNMEAKIEQLLIDLTQGIIDRDEYNYMKKQYSKRYDDLLREETQILSDMSIKNTAFNLTGKWFEAIKKYQKLPVIDSTLLNLLVNRIEVSKDKTIKIILNYQDPYKPIREFMNRAEVIKDVS